MPGADAVLHEQAARRASDQIDPYALIERAEKLINTEPHDAVVFALRAQSVARARTAETLMARAHFVAGSALDAGWRLVGCNAAPVAGRAHLPCAERHRGAVPGHHSVVDRVLRAG